MSTGQRPERGTVTAEFALTFPAVVLALVLAIAVGQVVLAQVSCVDAARVGARQAARGEAAGVVVREAQLAGPDGAAVTVTRSGRTVGVDVTAAVRLALPGSPAVTVHGRAVSLAEQP
jgi:uncharacterized protein (UPF0333 family)